MANEIDSSIIEAARNGRSGAITLIVERFSPPLLRYVRAIVGDAHEAEDLVQQTFVNAIRQLGTFEAAKGAFSTWLFRIARNAALNHLRSRRRSRVDFATPLPEPREDCDPSARILSREQFERLDAALGQLTAAQRSAWLLLEVERLPIAKIAEIEGTAEGTIKSRVSRARDALRKSVSLQDAREP